MNKKLLLLGVCMALCLTSSAKRLGVYCFFADNGQQVYEDDMVKVALAVESNSMVAAIYNKTDEIVYVDKGQSFVYVNGVPENLFKNSVTTTTTTSTSGGAVNLGGVAGALGIGGVAGGILRGTTVGGASTSGTGTTVYEQRVIAIAPKSASILYTTKSSIKYSFTSSQISLGSGYRHDRLVSPQSGQKTKIALGMTRHFDESSAPFSMQAIIKYSQKEDFSTDRTAKVYNYISDYVVDNYKGVNGQVSLPYCQNYSGKNVYRYVSGASWIESPGGIVAASVVGVAALSAALVVVATNETKSKPSRPKR